MKILAATGLALSLAILHPAGAAESIKVGLVTTLSGPAGIIGSQVSDGARLALAHLNGKIGGLRAELLIEDDHQKPDLGVEVANKFLHSDKVDAIIGGTFSNITLAMVGPIERAETVIISAVAGPSQLAGKECSRYFFSVSWQGDNFGEAMGSWLQASHKQNLFLMAPNYAAGHDVIAGFKRYYKGSIADEIYTPLGQARLRGGAVADPRAQPFGRVRLLSGRPRHPVRQAICAGRA